MTLIEVRQPCAIRSSGLLLGPILFSDLLSDLILIY